MIKKLMSHKKEIIILAILLAVSAFSHGYNMLQYPYYENDEGTYMSQAWSVSEQGSLAPYTYWYDHAPAGWLFIAAWAKATGGYFTFGDAMASGRIFMLILHVCVAGLLYYITRKLSGSILASVITVLLFSLSPLAIYFQRRILLDNIMVFWSLISIALLLKNNLKMRHILLSAVTFGIAILTKETAVFFIPALLYAIYLNSHASHRRIALIQWTVVMGCVTSLYFFYALLKGEFFPVQEGEQRVSLLDTLAFQNSRGSGYPFWNPQSDFYQTFATWMMRDPYILAFGIVSVLILAIFALRNKKLRIPTLLALFFWVFLMRGGLIIDFYILPIIPLFALAVGVVAYKFSEMFPRKIQLALAPILLFTLVLPSTLHMNKQYVRVETSPQLQAAEWVRQNVDPLDHVVIEDSIYLELRNPNKGPVFPNAEWYWKVQRDPAIRFDKYHNSWKNIDYIVVSHETLKTIGKGEIDFIGSILENSELVKSWGPISNETYLNIEQRKSTNGDWAQVYKVRDPDEVYLANSWKTYKASQVISYGQVTDPYNGDRTTSEGQSYALLRAVVLNDKDAFVGVLQWTKDHMQYRNEDKLFSWLWEKRAGKYMQIDSATASDADEDIALALLLANRRWGEPKYLEEAKKIIQDIWKHEVVKVNGKHYLVSSASARREDAYLVNPSYLSPASYKMFAEVDIAHDWLAVADSSYDLLEKLSVGTAGALRLPTDWVLLDAKSGAVSSAAKYMTQTADQYGYDAFRVMWRIALDAEWYQEPRAKKYLQKYHDFFYSEWKGNRLVSVYTADGMPVNADRNISTDIGALSVFIVTDKNVAEEFYQDRIVPKYNEEGYWEEKNNYYGQNWAWLGLGLYKGSLNNL